MAKGSRRSAGYFIAAISAIAALTAAGFSYAQTAVKPGIVNTKQFQTKPQMIQTQDDCTTQLQECTNQLTKCAADKAQCDANLKAKTDALTACQQASAAPTAKDLVYTHFYLSGLSCGGIACHIAANVHFADQSKGDERLAKPIEFYLSSTQPGEPIEGAKVISTRNYYWKTAFNNNVGIDKEPWQFDLNPYGSIVETKANAGLNNKIICTSFTLVDSAFQNDRWRQGGELINPELGYKGPCYVKTNQL